MLILDRPAVMPQRGIGASPTHPVIVATDGREQSDCAMAIGRLIASDRGAMRIITVLKPLPIMSAEGPLPMSADVEADRRALHRRRVFDQGCRVLGQPIDVELAEGDAALMLARIARQSRARMIVSGIGRHNISDRMFGDETALRLARVAEVPILAVADGLENAPSRIVIAMDYSESSISAARLALQLAAPNATIFLTHVAPLDSAPGRHALIDRERERALRTLRDRLPVPSGIMVHPLLVKGDIATELLALASRDNCDLIAAGSHGYGFVERLLVGSVTTRLLRASICSVLCVPPSAVTRPMHSIATGRAVQ
jgi:nucleotide-binding universal stress UspA family protein